MTDDFTLSRRKALAALGGIGAASVGAGMGTSAYFSDQETFQNNEIVAGKNDLKLDWQQRLTQSPTKFVNSYPDPNGDGVQSFGGLDFAGSLGDPVRAHDIPDVCGDCGDGQLAIQQGNQGLCVDVIQGTTPVEEFYDYKGTTVSGDFRFSSGNTNIQADDAGRVFFYRGPSGDLFLVVIFGKVSTGNGGQATFDLAGLDSAVGPNPWVLEDDAGTYDPDEYSAQQAVWGWADGKTDGGIAGPLTAAPNHDGFCLAIDPSIAGVSNLQVLDGDTSTVVDLDPTQKFTICNNTGLKSGSELSVPDVYQSVEAPNQQHLIEVEDVKPGDRGKTVFSLHNCDIETYVWWFARNYTQRENGVTEPESDDSQEDGTEANPGADPELGEVLQTRWWYDEDCNEQFDSGSETIIFEGSLDDAMAIFTQTNANGVPGVPLDGDRSTPYDAVVNGVVDDGVDPNRDCFTPKTTICIGVEWWLPVDHGNQVQTDSVTFDLGFYSEQCSANDGSGQGPEVPIALQNATITGGQRHTLTIDVGSGDDGETLTDVEVAYPAGFDLSGITSINDVTATHEGSDVSSAIDGFSVSGGTTLAVSFGGSAPSLQQGDSLVLEYPVDTEPSGTHQVNVTVNGDGTTTATFTV